jgi:hypothetical protein
VSAESPRHPWQELARYQTPMDIAWNFSYEIDIEKLRNLYSKAKQNQWDGETYLDWSIEIDPSQPIVGEDRFFFHQIPFFQRLSKTQRETFTAHATCQLLSQFLHGEQGALMTAAAVTHAAPDYEAKLYSATQTFDEARHVEVYDRYIQKLGVVYPISPWLKQTIDATLSAGNFAKTMIGMNMVVEGLAVRHREGDGRLDRRNRRQPAAEARSRLQDRAREQRHRAQGLRRGPARGAGAGNPAEAAAREHPLAEGPDDAGSRPRRRRHPAHP